MNSNTDRMEPVRGSRDQFAIIYLDGKRFDSVMDARKYLRDCGFTEDETVAYIMTLRRAMR